MTQYTMVIGTERPASDRLFEVRNPATEGVAGAAPECTEHELDAAMEAASRAFEPWAADDEERRVILRKASAALFDAVDSLAPVLTSETGKPLRRAAEEVFGAAAWLSYYADLELPSEVLRPNEQSIIEVRRRPMGVVSAIAPWNYPLVLSSWKFAPALRAGNTVVLKPSPFTPLATLMMVDLLAEILPPGVLNVVSGNDELGAWMTRHPLARKVSFTGSISTGKAVAASAAHDLKRVTLELGGNDAAIVLDDIDVPTTSAGIFAAAFQNSGQVCSAIKRVYVPRPIYEDVVEALSTLAERAIVGDPLDDATELGPVSNEPQYHRVLGLIRDAIDHGAVATAGGVALDGPGYFVAPTILKDAAEGLAVVDEEQFGPVLPVLAYDDLNEAIGRANGTMYGLGGSVWSSDVERAASVAVRLECGTVWVNRHLGLVPFAPFGGVKWSGIGVENGLRGLEGFTDLQVLHRPT
jgi:acyl-CoA reductase-like NAD-dependent aldehyde dehydrogenase